MSIRVKAILAIVLTTTIIILFSVFAGIATTKKGIDKSQETALMLIADIADHFISREIEILKLKSVATAQSLTMAEESAWPAVLANREAYDFIGMAVLDPIRGVIASAGVLPAPPDILADRYIKQALNGKEALSSTIATTSHGVVFYLGVPIPGTDNNILVLTLPGIYFSELLSTIAVWQSGYVFIDDAEGYKIADRRAEWVETRINFIRLAETDLQYEKQAAVQKRAVEGEIGIGRYSFSGVPRLCAFRPVRGSDEGWSLGVVAPLPESPFGDIHKGLIVVGLVGFFLSVIAAIVASGFIKKPFDEIKALKEEAEADSKSKSNFLAKMSHEIRTPMNVILGITEILLREKTLGQSTLEGLSRIYNSGDLLLGLINDILDLSVIEAGKLGLVIEEYDVASLVNDTVALNMMRRGSKPIEFKLHVDENTPSFLFGDVLRIRQILNNLLSNAFKYTEKGTVQLSVAAEREGEEKDSGLTLVFSVSDTGQGLSEEEVTAMFDDYSRFNLKANRATEGTGLGMSIVGNLLRLMKGSITVESELNKGSVFTVRLPQGRSESSVLGRELADNLQNFSMNGRRRLKRERILFEPMPYGSVLVVDDLPSNLFVTKGLMAPYGLSVDIATSGFEAIVKIKSGKTYDIVFMDHMMPMMDGIEAARIMREGGYRGPIVALTANAMIGQTDMCKAHGFDDFISKPVDMQHLNAILKKYVRDKQPPEIIEAARRQMETTEYGREEGGGHSPQLIEAFMRDAAKAAEVLEAIYKKHDAIQDEDLLMLTLNAHGVKSALTNVGESGLSLFAGKLEEAGREKNTALIAAETPAFLDELRAVIKKFTLEEREGTDADYEHLREKLHTIKEACGIYDKKTAKDEINGLRKKTWPPAVRELLYSMAEQLLSGDFEMVAQTADRIILGCARIEGDD